MNKNLVLMAIAAGNPVSEGKAFPVYTGVPMIKIIAINPNKKELEAIYGRTFDAEPVYFEKDKAGIDRLRLDFIVQTIPDKSNGVELISRITYWINNATHYNGDKTGIEVLNAFGQSTWMTKEQFQNKVLPDGVKPHLFLMEGVRPAYMGERRVIDLLRAAVNIPRVSNFETGEIIADKNSALCSLDTIKDMVTKGNVTELKKVLPAMKPFKMGAGARTTDNNRTYQDWFVDYPMKGGVSDMKFYDNRVKASKDRGGYANTDFGKMPYKFEEYVAQPTDLKAVMADPMDIPVVGMEDPMTEWV